MLSMSLISTVNEQLSSAERAVSDTVQWQFSKGIYPAVYILTFSMVQRKPCFYQRIKIYTITQSACQAPESASFHLNGAAMQVQEWALHDGRDRKRASYK